MSEMTLNHQSIYFRVEEVAKARGFAIAPETVQAFTETILQEMESQYLYQRGKSHAS